MEEYHEFCGEGGDAPSYHKVHSDEQTDRRYPDPSPSILFVEGKGNGLRNS
jgi:hypothetical protein